MKDKKLEYIEILLKKREDVFLGGSYSLIIHSILNTFDLIELIDFYLPLTDTKLKRSIESNITSVFCLYKIQIIFMIYCKRD